MSDDVDVTSTKAYITSYQDSERYRTSQLNMTESDINIHADIYYVNIQDVVDHKLINMTVLNHLIPF